MASVISDVTCPECGYEYCLSDYYYKSNERFISCGRCGYHRIDAKGINLKEPENEEEQEGKGIGAYTFYPKEGKVGQRGCFGKEKQREEFLNWFEEDKDELEEATITKKIDGGWYQIDLFTREKTKIEKDTPIRRSENK